MSRHADPSSGNSHPPERILVPVDFSDCAAEVVAHAIEIARSTPAALELLHVIDLDGVDPDMPMQNPNGNGTTTAASLLDAEARTSLANLAAQAQAAQVDVCVSTVYGTPAQAILEHAQSTAASRIVMGTHGRRGVSRWVLGSVAEDVTRAASIPVVTHRTEHKPHCEPGSCAWCGSHMTPATRRIRAERDG